MRKINSKNTLVFIICAFLASWIIWGFCFIADDKTGGILRIVGTFGPSVSAIIISLVSNKKETVGIMKSAVNVRIKAVDYLLIFLLLPAVTAISYLIMRVSRLETPDFSYKVLELPVVFLYIFALMGPLGEELGWRGFLLPKLLRKQNTLTAGIVLGLIWTVWHLPLFFINGALQNSFVRTFGYTAAFIGYAYYTVLMSIFISIIFVRSRGSTFAALIIHTMGNMSIGCMPVVFSRTGAAIQLSLMTVAVAALAIANRRILFKKGK